MQAGTSMSPAACWGSAPEKHCMTDRDRDRDRETDRERQIKGKDIQGQRKTGRRQRQIKTDRERETERDRQRQTHRDRERRTDKILY